MAKRIYIGTKMLPKTLTSSNCSSLFVVSNGNPTFMWSGTVLKAENLGQDGSSATITLKAKADMTLTFSYAYVTESRYDKFTVIVGSTTVLNAVSGTSSGTWSGTISAGQNITLTYSKDTSTSASGETAQISDIYCIPTSTSPVSIDISKLYISANESAKHITKGYIGVNDVAKLFYDPGSLSSLSVGSIVNVRCSNRLDEYVIVQKGKPESNKYDSTTNGIWLMKRTPWINDWIYWQGTYAWFQPFNRTPYTGMYDSIYAKYSESVKSCIMPARYPTFGPEYDDDTIPKYWNLSDIPLREISAPAVTEMTTSTGGYGWEAESTNGVPKEGQILEFFATHTGSELSAIFSATSALGTTILSRSHVYRATYAGEQIYSTFYWECGQSGDIIVPFSSGGGNGVSVHPYPLIIVNMSTTVKQLES